jgi:hypothetical protein
MPAPFVKSHKHDYVDAKAIAEALQRPSMRHQKARRLRHRAGLKGSVTEK